VVVPAYMKEACPGLPDWEALLEPDCAEAFATPETAPDGRYLGGPVTWGGFDEERVEALDLPFQVIHAGTDAALFAELESATSGRRRCCSGSTRRTGRRSSTRATGSRSPNTPPSATRTPPGA
jgi:ABC-type proline/glycine betaine transport system substrate-binding protein